MSLPILPWFGGETPFSPAGLAPGILAPHCCLTWYEEERFKIQHKPKWRTLESVHCVGLESYKKEPLCVYIKRKVFELFWEVKAFTRKNKPLRLVCISMWKGSLWGPMNQKACQEAALWREEWVGSWSLTCLMSNSHYKWQNVFFWSINWQYSSCSFWSLSNSLQFLKDRVLFL